MEDAIEQIVSYLRHAAQGLEEKKQILYLLGPVGGGKSSLAERLKQLMERVSFYAIEGSPVFESPLGLFNPDEDGRSWKTITASRAVTCAISCRRGPPSVAEYNGDITKFRVVKLRPSILHQIAVAKTEPGDENNQDISSLVGKVDIRKLEHFAQNDPDAYSFSGALCRANRGLMEFVEMFKAPIKVLHPLADRDSGRQLQQHRGLSAIPFEGIILAHSNESEWQSFKNNKNNEAFLDRVYIVKVPYCLRVSDEVKIYRKLLTHSSLSEAPCAPGTLEMLAQFSVLTRIKEPENSNMFSKMRVYDGENLKDTDPKAKSMQEYRDYAGVDEGMTGISTRFAFKILSQVFNFDHAEVAANPVHLLYVLERQIEREQFAAEVEEKYLSYLKGYLAPRYAEFIGKELQQAYLESYSEYGQNIFDRYVTYADFWIQDQEYRDPDTGESFDRGALNTELEKIEKPAGISNPKDFRNEIVNFVLRARANNAGQESGLDQLREAAGGDREENVLDHRGFAAGDQLQRQGQRRGAEEARPVRGSDGRQGLYRQAGAIAVRLVLAGSQGILTGEIAHGHAYRPAAGRQEQKCGQPPALHPALQKPDQEGRDRGHEWPQHHRYRQRRESQHPGPRSVRAGVRPRPGGRREAIHPGNKEFIKGDRMARPQGGGGGGTGGGQASNSGEGEDDFVFELSREEFLELFFEDLELPNLVRTQLAKATEFKSVRAGFTSAGNPSNIDVVRSLRGALARRMAMAAPYSRRLHEAEEKLQQPIAESPVDEIRAQALVEEIDTCGRGCGRCRLSTPSICAMSIASKQPQPTPRR
jgi:serine protein kinase